MNIDEYLSAYSEYKKFFISMQKIKNSFENQQNLSTDSPNISCLLSYSNFYKEYQHRERILVHGEAKLQAAIARIGDTSFANYLMCRYFYGMKNSEIALTFCYCERHIYRISSSAKKRLYEELLKLMPKVRRGEKNKTFRYTPKIMRKH